MASLRALLFDVDGTLADSERDGHRVAFNQAFKEAGLDWFWSVDEYADLLRVTGGKERMLHFVKTRHAAVPAGANLAALIQQLHQEKTRHYLSMLDQGMIPLRAGIRRLLHEARQSDLHIAIVTTTTPDNVTALLRNTLGEESPEWFSFIAAGDIVPRKKPAPDIYTYTMAELGLAPEECVAFEDSEMGLRSARDAGIQCVIVTANGYTLSHDFAGATTVLDHLGDDEQPVHHFAGLAPTRHLIDLAEIRRIHNHSS